MATRRRPASTPSASGPGPLRAYTDQMREQAETRSLLAARYLGLSKDGSGDSSWECPIEGHFKMRIFQRGCHCHSCGKAVNSQDAIFMLIDFGKARGLWDHEPDARGAAMARAVEDAVLLLCGRKAPNSGVEPLDLQTVQTALAAPRRTHSTCDPEVYAAILTAGRAETHGFSAAAAADHYASSGIDRLIAIGAGAVALTDPDVGHAWLLETFGEDRINESGIRKAKTGYWLLRDTYPFVEPHTHPSWVDGRPAVTSLQFRCSDATKKMVDAHSKAKREGGDTKAHPYVMKFMSLWGPAPDTRAGFGAASLTTLPKRSMVLLTEGFKDRLAGLTLVRHLSQRVGVIGLPGATTRPPDAVLQQLRDHLVVICFDPDEGGDEGRQMLGDYLVANGQPSGQIVNFRPEGGDLAEATERMAAASGTANLTDAQWAGLQRRFEPYLPTEDTADAA